MQYVPKVEYGSGPTVLRFTHWQKLWTPSSQPVGGSNVSDSGVPETFIIRRDQKVDLELRFTEAELASVMAWLEWAQDNATSFYYWFNAEDITTRYSVYLESPSLGDGEIKPDRDEYRSVYSIKVTLRSTNGTRFDVRTNAPWPL